MHKELEMVLAIYKMLGVSIQNLIIEDEGFDYGATEFTLDKRFIKFRVGKTTPKKIGQFVTFWKRLENGETSPYGSVDDLDYLIVSVKNGKQFGQFILPKKILMEKGIISTLEQEGKRGFRIYPPWATADNNQSKRTQAWQLMYFIDLSDQDRIDSVCLRSLLN